MRLQLGGGSEEACGAWCWLRGSGGLVTSGGVGGQLGEGQVGGWGGRWPGQEHSRAPPLGSLAKHSYRAGDGLGSGGLVQGLTFLLLATYAG